MSLYKDASLVMIPSAVKDGKLYSMRPTPEYGAELVTNGDFDTDSDWTKETGWTISGGKASYNGSAATSALYQNISAVSGTKYRVSFSVVNYVSGSVRAHLSNGSGTGASPLITANGDYVFDITATGGLLLFRNVTSFNGSIDNVSVQEITKSGDFTFSRGSNLAATRVDVNGLIEKGRENLLLYSNDFSQWTKSGATATGGQSGYDGSSDAWLITKSGGAFDQVLRNVSSSGVNTISFYAKAGTLTSVYFRGQASSNIPDVKFNLSDGSLTSSNNVISASSEDIGSGWYRLKMTFSNTITNVTIYPDFGQTTAGTIYIQDAQLEQGLVATDYIETGASTAQAGILEDLPRLDYSGGASCPSLLLEPQRTNNVPHSEYLEGLSSVNASLSANEAISPDSGNNATKLGAFVATPNSQWARYYNIVQPNQKQALSIYAKAGNINDFTITYYDQSTGDLFFNYDLGAGSVSAPTGNANYVDADIQDLGNGWYRCIAVVNAQASGTNAEFQVSAGFNRKVPNIGDYVYIYGYQWEQNASYPTSYIPTMGSAVTRSSDAMANLDIPDFNDNTSFSVLLELTRNGISSSEIGSMFSFYNDSLTQQFWFHIDAPNAQVRLRDATNSNATMATISFDTDDRKKIAFSCDGSTLKTYADGVLSNTYNLVNVFNVDELRTAAKSFDVHQIVTFPTALTDSECIALTTL
jgi:hypothetical protein